MPRIMINVNKMESLVEPYYKVLSTELDKCSSEISNIKILSGVNGNISTLLEEIADIKRDVVKIETWLSDLKNDYNSKIADVNDEIAKINDDVIKARTRLIV